MFVFQTAIIPDSVLATKLALVLIVAIALRDRTSSSVKNLFMGGSQFEKFIVAWKREARCTLDSGQGCQNDLSFFGMESFY